MSQSAREVLTALRPMQGFAEQVTRFIGVAHEAIRLEEGLASANATLATLRTAVASMTSERDRLTAEIAGLERRMAAERDAALAALEAETEERRRSIEAVLAQRQALAASWDAKALAAQSEYERKRNGLAADEAALEKRVAALREQAQRMLRSAEAVLG